MARSKKFFWRARRATLQPALSAMSVQASSVALAPALGATLGRSSLSVLFRGFRVTALSALACLGLAVIAVPALAHHAFAAEYDGDKPLDLTGVVTKARWVNPHSWLYFDVKATDGTVTNWGVELGAPNALASKGLQKTDLQPGAEIQVKGYRSKNGGPYGYAVTVTLHDGRSFQTGGAQDVPQPGGAQK
jgi:hypothetical protein